jgi:hypothetical protein
MIEKLNVSWVAKVKSAPSNGGNVSGPEWREIEERLSLSLANGGTVTLDAEDENGRSSSLQVRAEEGKFVIMLGEESIEGWKVRTYKNPTCKLEKISILGDVWSDQIICHEAHLVMTAFREFFETGNVSEAILSS